MQQRISDGRNERKKISTQVKYNILKSQDTEQMDRSEVGNKRDEYDGFNRLNGPLKSYCYHDILACCSPDQKEKRDTWQPCHKQV